MHCCLFEDDHVSHLRPLVDTRPVYDLRLGIRTLLETTHDALGQPAIILHTRPHLAAMVAVEHPDVLVNQIPTGANVLFVNGRLIAEDAPLVEHIRRMATGTETARCFIQDDILLAAWVPDAVAHLPLNMLEAEALTAASFDGLPTVDVDGAPLIGRLWHVLDALDPALRRDFHARTGAYNILDDIYDRPGTDVHASAVAVHPEHIYLGSDVRIQPGAILNAEGGPIYIDEGATVFERAVVRGPAYIGTRAQVKVGADVQGCSIGFYCKVGGEVQGSVLHALSSKGHAGYLGDSYLGRWCNLGADTNTSNLKNDYGEVTLYDYATGSYEPTGRQFIGAFMGDHTKCGINTMLNTGTVIGPFCNVYGPGFPPRYLPAFSWGGSPGGFTDYRIDKALRVAEAVMKRRDRQLTEAERILLSYLFETAAEDRARVHGSLSEGTTL